MALPVTTVQGTVLPQSGQSSSMTLHIRLTKADVDSTEGIVVPETIEVVPDANGAISVDLWPNDRGSKSSQYRIWAQPDKCKEPIWDAYFSVPSSGPANLRDILI